LDMEKLTLDDVGLLLRHRRQATIGRLFDIGVTERTRDQAKSGLTEAIAEQIVS